VNTKLEARTVDASNLQASKSKITDLPKDTELMSVIGPVIAWHAITAVNLCVKDTGHG
jgi:hypothetical protein